MTWKCTNFIWSMHLESPPCANLSIFWLLILCCFGSGEKVDTSDSLATQAMNLACAPFWKCLPSLLWNRHNINIGWVPEIAKIYIGPQDLLCVFTRFWNDAMLQYIHCIERDSILNLLHQWCINYFIKMYFVHGNMAVLLLALWSAMVRGIYI